MPSATIAPPQQHAATESDDSNAAELPSSAPASSTTEAADTPTPADQPADDLSEALSHLSELEGIDLPGMRPAEQGEQAVEENEDERTEAEPTTEATEDDEEATAPEDEPEATDDEEEEASEEGEDPEAEQEDDSDLPEGVQKRIDTLVGMRDKFREQRDEARTKLEDLEEKVAQLETGAVSLTPTERSPLADLTDARAVEKRIQEAEAAIAWAERNPDGDVIRDKDGNELEYTAEDVQRIRLNSERIKEIHGPKRLDYLRNHQHAVEAAKQVYPEMYEDCPFAVAADQFINANPGLLENPNYPYLVGDWVVGAAVRHGIFRAVPVKKKASASGDKQQDQEKATTPAKQQTAPAKAKREEATPPPQPSNLAPPRRPRADMNRDQARQRLLDSGGEDEDALLAVAASLG